MEKCPPTNTEHDECSSPHNDGVTEVKLLYTTRFTADKYDISCGLCFQAVIVLQNGALCPTRE